MISYWELKLKIPLTLDWKLNWFVFHTKSLEIK